MEFSLAAPENLSRCPPQEYLQHLAAHLPDAAHHASVATGLEKWEQAIAASSCAEELQHFSHQPEGRKLLAAIFGNSPFLSQCVMKEPEFLAYILRYGVDSLFPHLLQTIARHPLETNPSEMLRVMKRRVAFLTALADISGLWSLEQVTQALSQFADAAVTCGVRYLLLEAVRSGTITLQDHAKPETHSGLIVIGMGKLGAGELNYSSDIDLIVFYDETRLEYHGRQTPGQFYQRLTQNLANMLQDRTKDGYVFRTDLRLRPDPGSNPVAVSIRNAAIYYETVGQNWERAAMIKARIIIGDSDTAAIFEEFITPYIWRRALDFASIQDIHSIKRQIDSRQGKLPDNLYGYNVKLGRGGIREIEFFAQTQQLIWGGRREKLRCKPTCEALNMLVELQEVPSQMRDELIEAYRFYRKVEHRLQMIDDQQTHTLPDTPEKMQELAVFLGYAHASDFISELTAAIICVQGHYAELFGQSPSLASDISGSLVFTGTDEDPDTLQTLRDMGFEDVERLSATIRGWHHGRYRAMRTKRARELLTELMPNLLKSFANTTHPDTAFFKFDEFLSKLPAGVQIFSLFYANPALLDLIAEIMGGYPYIANNLSHSPILLDYVLTPEFYNSLPNIEALKNNLAEALISSRDLEDVLNATRYWSNDRRFRIGIQCIKKQITFREASRHLTHIAEAAIATLMDIVQQEFAIQHGEVEEGEFAILGLGKLGGREMTFSSDLDLVFVYDVPDSQLQSNGEKPLPASEYYSRLSRRLVSALTALTPQGSLYDVDLRLRPSGLDGPVVSYIHAFRDYYNGSSAWAWEHLALTRARVIYSSTPEFTHRVGEQIEAILRKERRNPEFARGVLDMHARLKKAFPTTFPFRIKHAPGGLVDLEYIAQYLQLKFGHNHPCILQPHTVQSLEQIRESQLISADDAGVLVEAAGLYAEIQGCMRLMGVRKAEEGALTPGVQRTLGYHIPCENFEELEKRLVSTEEKVEKLFHKIIVEDAGA